MSRDEAWTRHASQNGLTTSNCQWSRAMWDFAKQNFGARYKTGQMYDLAKRVFNSISNGLQCMKEFSDCMGEQADMAHPELNSLNCLQNLHVLSKIVMVSLQHSYPQQLLAMLFMEGAKMMVSWEYESQW